MNEEKIIEILLNMQIDNNAQFEKINERFDKLESGMNARFDSLESEIKAIHEQTQDLVEL